VSAPPAKPAGASAPAAPAKPAAPAAPKPPVVLQTPLDNEFVTRFRAKFGAALIEAMQDRKQSILTVDRARLVELALHLRDEEKFDMLADLTAVDWPKREKRFDVVLNLYSFAKNERLMVKVHAADAEEVPSVVSVWPTANWQEREVFDMFGRGVRLCRLGRTGTPCAAASRTTDQREGRGLHPGILFQGLGSAAASRADLSERLFNGGRSSGLLRNASWPPVGLVCRGHCALTHPAVKRPGDRRSANTVLN